MDTDRWALTPSPDFWALVSCQSIGAGNTATITNVSTSDTAANTAADSTINAQVSLPKPCIAPIVFVTGPTGSDFWFSVNGSDLAPPTKRPGIGPRAGE